MARLCVFSILVIFFLTSDAAARDPDDPCVYTVYVYTGSVLKAGTNSNISISFGDPAGSKVTVSNLADKWGMMGLGHDYYERGALDIFAGRGPCLTRPICRLNLTSDGSGSHHGWYCDHVEITTAMPRAACAKSTFPIHQWLAEDAPPYELTAVVDWCHTRQDRRQGGDEEDVDGDAIASQSVASA